MYKFLFLICFLLVTKSFAVDTCHQFYQERVDLNKAYKAYDCYLQLVEIDESISESLFLSATRIYNHETDKDKKIKLMSSMLAWIEKKPAIKNYKYWRAVFLTFYSEQKDKGKIIPSEKT